MCIKNVYNIHTQIISIDTYKCICIYVYENKHIYIFVLFYFFTELLDLFLLSSVKMSIFKGGGHPAKFIFIW